MKFSYRWLKELSGTKRSPERLSELLMLHSFEVESVEAYPHGLENVLIGKVLAVKKHPNADRLRVATVKCSKSDTREIVCGAPNLAVGQMVAVALPGSHLPGGVVIKETELRGVTSEGMITSMKELGLGTDHTGILVLPADAPLGHEFAEYAGLDDTLLDVKILPDRSADALSYRGLAREIAALEGTQPAFLVHPEKRVRLRSGSKVPKVTLKTERATRYVAVLLEDVTEKLSPLEVQVRLIVSGLRPINAVVDLTNYLMLLTGQPIHAFDADAIPPAGIVVRQARSREKLLLLDGRTITLSPDDIVIADAKKPIALAGVMGGKHSGVTARTKRVVFELAHFDAKSVRRTEKRYHLLTDAAYRFERGLDPARPVQVAEDLLRLCQTWDLGTSLGVRDVGKKKFPETQIILEVNAVERLLGLKVPMFEIVQYFSWLGLTVKKVPNRQALRVTVPVSRPDLKEPEDLIEEIGRLRGYQHIESVSPLLPLVPTGLDRAKAYERDAKSLLVSRGFDEVMTYSFYGKKALDLVDLPESEHLTLANPMNPDQALMRSSLFPNLLMAAQHNAKYFDQFSLFEWGSVFQKGKKEPVERKQIGLCVASRVANEKEDLFLGLKGHIEALLRASHIEVEWKDVVDDHASVHFHPTRTARLYVHDVHLGTVGEIHPDLMKKGGASMKQAYAELSVDALLSLEKRDLIYTEVSKFPLAHRDISLVGPATVTYGSLELVLAEAGKPLLVSYELFDVYEQGKEKSFALHLAFGSPNRTLGGSEMDEVFERIVKHMEGRLGLRLKA